MIGSRKCADNFFNNILKIYEDSDEQKKLQHLIKLCRNIKKCHI